MATPGDALGRVLAAKASTAGIFTDFDGTLALIVDDPGAARPLTGAPAVLASLARRFAVVGVISGRPAAFLHEHFGGCGVQLWGLYGLQRAVEGDIVEDEEVARWRPVVEEVASRADTESPNGMVVERKGAAVTLHFRTTPGAEDFVRRWAEAEGERTGLRVLHARKSFELRPPVERDKGTVLETLARDLDAATFIGDDQGDLACFDALDRLEARGVRAVRVAVRSGESPPELLERADVVVDGPEGALAWLRALDAIPAEG